jgi:hypothetical protein
MGAAIHHMQLLLLSLLSIYGGPLLLIVMFADLYKAADQHDLNCLV